MTGSKVVGVIPARFGSTMLPGKPLEMIGDRPMVVHVYQRALDTGLLNEVVVATDDERIKDAVESHGGRAMLTDTEHPSGTDRVAEVADCLGLEERDLVVNIQGDQPLLAREPVAAMVTLMRQEPDLEMATVACHLDPAQASNPNRVKVVVDQRGRALYFSRSPIPHYRDGLPERGPAYLHHLGLYIFRRSFLSLFVSLEPGVLEEAEKLEQLRALENGHSIGVALVPEAPVEVDTPEDLVRVRELFAS